jgi:formylglycine-generating enzyme required for sulfatase activity
MMKRAFLFAVMSAAAAAGAGTSAEPSITAVDFTQDSVTREITVVYTLSGWPAVVTADIQTNAGNSVYVSIGERNFAGIKGDVNRKVDPGAGRKMTWLAEMDAPDPEDLRVVVTAWPLNDPPDYMVVDLVKADTVNYYVSTNALPGGLFGSSVYRTTKLVLRKVKAEGVRFYSGNGTRVEYVQNNCYFGIFPVTQGQYTVMGLKNPSAFSRECDSAMRPVESVSFNQLRGAKTYPVKAPAEGGWLALARARTGVEFDLPGSSTWEYAARAGREFGYWGDGAAYGGDETDAVPGRYKHNGGNVGDGAATEIAAADAPKYGASSGTAVVGSHRPNDWGIYDTAGNVYEWCLDYISWDGSEMTTLAGKVNVNAADPAKDWFGAGGKSSRVLRGGNWTSNAKNCRPTTRTDNSQSYSHYKFGFRVVCPLEAK